MSAMIAVCAGLVAATLFGAASVLEERSSKQVPQRSALSPRLLVDLVRRPLFLASIGVNVAGCALQIAALHFGSLTLVQPLLVLSLLFAVVIASVVIQRRPPDAVLMTGVVCCAVGIAGFLAVARPHGGTGTAGPAAALPLAAGLAAVLAGCLAAARLGPVALRPLWLALGCGADFGVNALLLKIVPATLSAGFADPLQQWPLYLLVIVTPVGFLLNQNAFQAGTLIAPALAVITTADPLVSMAAGAAFLHEQIATAPLELATEGLALTATIGGVIILAQRAPQVAHLLNSPGPALPGCEAPVFGESARVGRSRQERPVGQRGHLRVQMRYDSRCHHDHGAVRPRVHAPAYCAVHGAHAVPAMPVRAPLRSVNCSITRPAGARWGPVWRLPSRRSASATARSCAVAVAVQPVSADCGGSWPAGLAAAPGRVMPGGRERAWSLRVG
jgi:drug/metabolite transporter (DMT)-like permease